MKLLIIVLCIAAEKYAAQVGHLRQRQWFSSLTHLLKAQFPAVHPAAMLSLIVFPIVFIVWIILHAVGVWSAAGFFVQAILLFFCLGPDTIFPGTPFKLSSVPEDYFYYANTQWFAVLFWYLVLGIEGAIVYRLIELASQEDQLKVITAPIMGYLDWIPARLTGVLYLLVGNFDQGYPFVLKNGWSGTEKNAAFLVGCGLNGARQEGNEEISFSQARQLVWHAMILFLVCLACVTLAAKW